MYLKTVSRLCTACALTLAAVFALSALGMAQAYQQTNLVSDIQGLAQNPPNGQPDPQLVNSWGLLRVLRVRGGFRTTTPVLRLSTTDKE